MDRRPYRRIVKYAAEYFFFASLDVSRFCRGIVLQTTSEYFNLLVNACQWGREIFLLRVERVQVGSLAFGIGVEGSCALPAPADAAPERNPS